MTIPELSLSLLPPGRMTAPRVVGGVIKGGRSQSGPGRVIDVSGGGFVTVKYANISINHQRIASARYFQKLTARLSQGRMSILVPLLTDPTAPFVPGEKYDQGFSMPFSDGSLFSDGSGFGQSQIVATLYAASALNAGTIQIAMQRGGELFGGEWFEIAHPTKSSRAYTISEIDDAVKVGATTVYTVAIRPTLREVVDAGTFLRFERPRCIMQVEGEMSMEITRPWNSRPEITFVEAFP